MIKVLLAKVAKPEEYATGMRRNDVYDGICIIPLDMLWLILQILTKKVVDCCRFTLFSI